MIQDTVFLETTTSPALAGTSCRIQNYPSALKYLLRMYIRIAHIKIMRQQSYKSCIFKEFHRMNLSGGYNESITGFDGKFFSLRSITNEYLNHCGTFNDKEEFLKTFMVMIADNASFLAFILIKLSPVLAASYLSQ